MSELRYSIVSWANNLGTAWLAGKGRGDGGNYIKGALEDRQPFHEGQELPGELEVDANNYLRKALEGRQPFHAGQELPGELEADANNYLRGA